jgi:hypothetical protein
MNTRPHGVAAPQVASECSAGTREVLRRKGFPEARLIGLWGRMGTRARCEHCGRSIATDEIEYELVFLQHAQTITLRFHRECWELGADPAAST